MLLGTRLIPKYLMGVKVVWEEMTTLQFHHTQKDVFCRPSFRFTPQEFISLHCCISCQGFFPRFRFDLTLVFKICKSYCCFSDDYCVCVGSHNVDCTYPDYKYHQHNNDVSVSKYFICSIGAVVGKRIIIGANLSKCYICCKMNQI